MAETIDGKLNKTDLESCIQFHEAKGNELTELAPGKDSPPTNEATFKELANGDLPDLFRITTGKIPAGRKKVWSGKIFIGGKKVSAKAFRDPE